MALTINNADSRSEDIWGRQKVRVVRVVFDSSYATGGEDFTPANVGLADITAVFISPESNGAASAGRMFQYNYTTRKIQSYEEEAVAAGGALIETPNATDLSTAALRVLVVGR